MVNLKRNNPISNIGWYLAVAATLYFFICWLLDLNVAIEFAILPASFMASFYFVIWTIFQFQTGKITLVSQSGSKHTYSRAKEPYLFFIVICLIFSMASFLTVALGSELFLGCEGSLINNC